ARTKRLGIGTSVLILPAYHPVFTAKALATIDVLSGGRLTVAVGIGAEEPQELEALNVPKSERGRRLNESIELIKRLWTEERVTYQGEFYRVTNLSLWPRPVRRAGVDILAGGATAAILRRVARLCDGWLPSYVTPEEVRAGIGTIRARAADANRIMADDAFGVLVPFTFGPRAPDWLARRRPDLVASAFVASGPSIVIRDFLKRYVAAGATRLLLAPAYSEDIQLERIRAELAAPLEEMW
ncbi:MAG: LLM class flavin-dependent oxidoreductase, partial [Chloroflexota bacterium]|nr:LLM class flavin-dependent oxidoreductase [Chloroflexota bacterium]